MDRRRLIFFVAAIGAASGIVGILFGASYPVLLAVAFVMGGMSNPLYSLLLAYTNDFLELDDMAAASGGLIFINGMGAILGPVITGWMMATFGPSGFWMVISLLMFALAGYAAYRMTQRPSIDVGETGAYVGFTQSTTALSVEAAQEWAAEQHDDA
jgi:MFS family permease